MVNQKAEPFLISQYFLDYIKEYKFKALSHSEDALLSPYCHQIGCRMCIDYLVPFKQRRKLVGLTIPVFGSI
jgi:hypothetical protein